MRTLAERRLSGRTLVPIHAPALMGTTATISVGSSPDSLPIGVPAGTRDGDLLLLIANLFNARGGGIPGWSTVVNVRGDGSTNGDVMVQSRVANSEPASYDFSFTGVSAAALYMLRIVGGTVTAVNSSLLPPFPSVGVSAATRSLLIVSASARNNSGVTTIEGFPALTVASVGAGNHTSVWAASTFDGIGPTGARSTDFSVAGGGALVTLAVTPP